MPRAAATRADARSAATLDVGDTIAAVASAAAPAARSIVRLSGPNALEIALRGFTPNSTSNPLPGKSASIRAGTLKVPGLRPLLPVMMAVWPGPRSYTGQRVAEIHLIGSAPLSALVLSNCIAQGARPAAPGEFTLRAFLSGRIDLTRAEAVLGVIEAHDPVQLEAALTQLAGGLSGPITALRDRLLDVVAHLEANLDFTEEPDVDAVSRDRLAQELTDAAGILEDLRSRLSARDRTSGHPRVVLTGPPNAGKSRLFNALLGQDRAIVSPVAGTTRDYLCELCDCHGLAVLLVDTAGAHEPADAVTRDAQDLRADQVAQADLLLECFSVETPLVPARRASFDVDRRLTVWTKADLSDRRRDHLRVEPAILTSAATGAGLTALRTAIAIALRRRNSEESALAGTAARCGGSLTRASAALRSASQIILDDGGDELVAFDLRLAVEELGAIVGAVVTDDILDRVFRRFCIGK